MKLIIYVVSILTLIIGYLNCSPNQFSSVQFKSMVECRDEGQQLACETETGRGLSTCFQGKFSKCVLDECKSGFHLSNQSCESNQCEPESESSCYVTNGQGLMKCGYDFKYQPCQITCNTGFYLDSEKRECVRENVSFYINGFLKEQIEFIEGQNYQLNIVLSPLTVLDQSKSVIEYKSGECQYFDYRMKKWTSNFTENGLLIQSGIQNLSMSESLFSRIFGCKWQACVQTISGTRKCIDGTNQCTPGKLFFEKPECFVDSFLGENICNPEGSGYSCVKKAECIVGQTDQSACLMVSNGQNQRNCGIDGKWGSCQILCDSTFQLIGNQCMCPSGYSLNTITKKCEIMICTPGSTTIQGCSQIVNGESIRTCDSSGLKYSDTCETRCEMGFVKSGNNCVCPSNFVEINGACVEKICQPSSTAACTGTNGSGTKTCNSTGSGYGSCTLTSCNSGYNLQNGSCVTNVCSPSSSAACTGTNGSGTKTCNSTGSGYGSCTLTSCNSGYNLQNGSCVTNVCSPSSSAACTGTNGSGTKTCNSTGSGYGSCTLTSCNSGYNLQNGSCVTNVCSPSSSAACTGTNGSGTKTCNSTGSGYGSCTLTSCNSGYNLQNGSCVTNVCSPSSSAACTGTNGSGTKTCNSTGSGYGSCTLTSCNSGYNLQNGSCVTNVCSPSSSAACTGTNGSGTKTCNSTGSGYGSCTLTSCNSGYNLQNGSCVTNVCSPSSSAACTGTNGSGTKTCNSTGSEYGSCALTSCNSGYNLQNGSCVTNVCSPSSSAACTGTNGSGTKTCNSTGSGYGSCTLTSCNSGYNLQNGSCVTNVCSPSSSAACTGTNGSGTKTCNSTGSEYGSCALTSCNSGYNLQNGSCVTNVCSPNTTTTDGCPVRTNMTVSRTCNSNGTAWSSCNYTCNDGHILKVDPVTLQCVTLTSQRFAATGMVGAQNCYSRNMYCDDLTMFCATVQNVLCSTKGITVKRNSYESGHTTCQRLGFFNGEKRLNVVCDDTYQEYWANCDMLLSGGYVNCRAESIVNPF